MAKGPDVDTLEELIGPVCMIADLRPTMEWPEEWRCLIGYARAVRKMEGFDVITMSTSD